MFTHLFIDRPILSSVISLLIVLAGAVSMSVSPIEQYPDMAPPQVTIDAIYPGATAEVIANNVARADRGAAERHRQPSLLLLDQLLERQLADRRGVQARQQSGHQPGQRAEQAQPGDAAACPRWWYSRGLVVDKKSPSIMMVVSVYSPDERYDAAYIDNYTNLYVLEELKRIPGANRSSVFGSPGHRDAGVAAPRPDGPARDQRAGESQPRSRARTRRSASARSEPLRCPPGVEQQFVVTAQGFAHQARGIREHHRAHRQGRRGERAHQGHRPRRARQARLLDARAE